MNDLRVAFLLFLNMNMPAQALLESCYQKQVAPLQAQLLHMRYTAAISELYHSPEPWQLLNYTGGGELWLSSDRFAKADSISRGGRSYFSRLVSDSGALLYQDYGDQALTATTPDAFSGRLLLSLNYSPLQLICALRSQQAMELPEKDPLEAVYGYTVGSSSLKMFVNRKSRLVTRITALAPDDLRGDVQTEWQYADAAQSGPLSYCKTVLVSKTNGRAGDVVSIRFAGLAERMPALLAKPADYAIRPEKEKQPDLKVSRYSDHIYLLDMLHVSTRVLMVRFDNYWLIIGAPLNTGNADIIYREAARLAPGKPVRYFTFGHHHPHYLGGMRAFVHKGATVICAREDSSYIHYLATTPHRLKPDSQYLQPRSLSGRFVRDSLVVSDGRYSMCIYHIGDGSGHTKDYMLFYFPFEKMLYEEDLVWIPVKGEARKAREGQVAVHRLVTGKSLAVDTILQSWGVGWGTYKTEIPFRDLEASVNENK